MEREEIHRSNDPKEGIKIMLEWKTKNINCKQVRSLSNQWLAPDLFMFNFECC